MANRRVIVPEAVETVVIGAGHAGLAASTALADRGLEHVVLERGSIGQTWRDQRWDSFRLNTPRWMSRLPGDRCRRETRDGYDTAGEFLAVLERHARRLRLPVREHAGDARVRRGPRGTFDVTAGGTTLRARNVIAAGGFLNRPRIPPAAAGVTPRVLQLDLSSYRSPGELPDGGVLVAGGGQSGGQIVEDLLDAGRDVVLATCRAGRVPRTYRGRDVLEWWTLTGFYEVRRTDLDDPAVARQPQPLLSGTMGGHTISLQSLARRGARLTGRLERADGELVGFGGGLAEHLRFADATAAKVRRDIDAQIAGRGIAAAAAEPDSAEHAPLPAPRAPRELRLDRQGIGTVIWSTGMTADLHWLAIPGLRRAGAVPHTDGETTVPGLYLIGAPWLRTRKSGIIYGAADDAERLADAIAARR